MDWQTILLLIIASAVAPKTVVTLAQFLPIPLKVKEILEKLTKNGNGYVTQEQFKIATNHNHHETTDYLKDIRDGVRDLNVKIDSIEPCKK